MSFPSPHDVLSRYPLSLKQASLVESFRQTARDIIEQKQPRLALLVGPCSIHDLESTLEYGEKLALLSQDLKMIFPIMRVFLEKPRTSLGWQGLLQDPDLNESYHIEKGLYLARQVLWELTRRNIPCATEFLDPMTAPYLEDCITWGLIGARTSSSQIHRKLASSFSFPIGFKNDLNGNLEPAIGGMMAARLPYRRIGIDANGKIQALSSSGNPFSHLVLRGSVHSINYDAASLEKAVQILQDNLLPPVVCIDCSHGNSQKKHTQQKIAFQTVVEQKKQGNKAIIGAMLESHLMEGRQKIQEELCYGVSITDACMSWEETKSLILWAEKELLNSLYNNFLRPEMVLPSAHRSALSI